MSWTHEQWAQAWTERWQRVPHSHYLYPWWRFESGEEREIGSYMHDGGHELEREKLWVRQGRSHFFQLHVAVLDDQRRKHISGGIFFAGPSVDSIMSLCDEHLQLPPLEIQVGQLWAFISPIHDRILFHAVVDTDDETWQQRALAELIEQRSAICVRNEQGYVWAHRDSVPTD